MVSPGTTSGPLVATADDAADDAVARAGAAGAAAVTPSLPGVRTIWGLDPLQLYTRFWAAHGVQVVRQGEPSQIVKHAELFLLTDPRSLVLFRLAPLMDVLNWVKPQVLFVRLHDTRERVYRELVVTDAEDRFVRFERVYDASDQLARVVLTPEREVAQLWQSAPDPLTGWRRLRRFTPRIDRVTMSVEGHAYDESADREMGQFLSDLLQVWKRPDSTVVRAQRARDDLWHDPESRIDAAARFIGPVWVGAGRHVGGGTTVVGPKVVWDDPRRRPASEPIQWLTIEPTAPPPDPTPRDVAPFSRAAKRVFDVVFAAFALAVTVPFYPLVMLAIWLEDGRPFFFSHRRETTGGREFPCLKFRSMRKDAERIKEQLKQLNQADGPQFYMENDPRLTRVGRALRKYNIDEMPQFWNVLLGHMSVVGPRPSPHRENQFCPAWREARLSVRPGITGLWQVRRTRRAGSDFQEWIKYDIEYVETMSFWLDIKIIFRTLLTMIRKGTRQ